jgi:hypothetical protein
LGRILIFQKRKIEDCPSLISTTKTVILQCSPFPSSKVIL